MPLPGPRVQGFSQGCPVGQKTLLGFTPQGSRRGLKRFLVVSFFRVLVFGNRFSLDSPFRVSVLGKRFLPDSFLRVFVLG